jgi:nucleoside-diphosphate-sugar epimerase
MRLIVTGSEGYLGSVLAPHLAKLGYEVNGIDALRYGASKDYVTCRDTADPFTWETTHDADVVINLAALVGEPLCSKYPDEAYRTNVVGTRLAAEWCNKHNAKLIHISTCSNYGVSEGVADEETPLNPLGVYAQTKVDSEAEAKRCSNYTILRLGTLYGPSPRMRWDTLLNEWVYDSLKKGCIEVYNPLAYRPFLHIEDACRAIEVTLMDAATRNETFNVAGFNIIKGALAREISLALDTKYISSPGTDARDYQVSSDKFAEATNFLFKHKYTLPADIYDLKDFAFVRKTSNVEDFVMP